MRSIRLLATAAALLVSVALIKAQRQNDNQRADLPLPPMIKIKIADFPDGGRIPNKYTCAAGPASPSPAITWSGAPTSTQSYVVIMHDPDRVLGGSANDPVLHWAIFDIPGNATGLPEGVKTGEQPNGSKHINNLWGNAGYMGACAPPGHGDHHYTFEVYGLNTKLGLRASTSRIDLLNAMNGKVIAKGVYIGVFGQK